MKVDEIMTRDPLTVEATATIQAAIDLMFAEDVRHMPVVEKGKLVAIISDRDVRSYVLPRDEQVLNPDAARARLDAPITDLMQNDVVSVAPSTRVREVVDIMIDERIGALPVVDEERGTLLGIVSYIDVLRAARDRF